MSICTAVTPPPLRDVSASGRFTKGVCFTRSGLSLFSNWPRTCGIRRPRRKVRVHPREILVVAGADLYPVTFVYLQCAVSNKLEIAIPARFNAKTLIALFA
jgi:hypothetical protein